MPFRYHFCQREAIETVVWLVEIAGQRDAQKLIQAHATIFEKDLFTKNITFQTTMDGRRQLRRYVPELDAEGVQDLPPQDLRRFAFKMATGSGKTWVVAMAIVWAHLHKQRVPGSELSTNFLIVAPNVIVYQRLEKDFSDNWTFNNLPLVPPEWGKLYLKVIKRGEAAEPDPSSNLFLTNIHQLYESRDGEWTPQNAIEALLGKKPAKDLAAAGQRSMLERVKSLNDVVVLNDEAHHVHDEDLAWNQSLLAIHRVLPQGLSLWLDFSATPKDQHGMYFPWTVCDYPLAQAVEDRIVKAPLIVTKEDDPKQPAEDPAGVTKDNIGEKYGYWLRAAVQRWKEHYKVYKQLGTRPVLFIMAEKNVYADAGRRRQKETARLGDAIAELAARIQAATYELLVMIREFDERGGWGEGFKSWRTGSTGEPVSRSGLYDQMRRLLSLDETRRTPLLKGPYITLSRPFREGAAVVDGTWYIRTSRELIAIGN